MKRAGHWLKLRESLLTGIKEIFYNKTRSLLTLSGIMLGVASLIAMMSITEGYRANFTQFMNSFGGLARITVSKLDDNTLAGLKQLYNVTGLTLDDMNRIAAENRDIIDSIAPQKTRGRFTVKYQNKSLQLFGDSVVGTTGSYRPLNNLSIGAGRNLGDFDSMTRSRVCVIGSIVRNELFGDADPVGEKISLNGRFFTVVGAFDQYTGKEKILRNVALEPAKKNTGRKLAIAVSGKVENTDFRKLFQKYGMQDPLWRKNITVIIPLETFKMLFSTEEQIDSIEIQFKDSADLNGYVARIKKTLAKTRTGYEDYSVTTRADFFEQTQSQMRTMSLVFGAIALISLFVGGIGIMNVILAAISERIREIGVRKSVGARDVDIFVQFLVETIILSLLGGLVGVLAGSGISVLIAKLASMKTAVSVFSIILSLVSSCLIGLIFGIYPSLKAAKLNPIDALRYE